MLFKGQSLSRFAPAPHLLARVHKGALLQIPDLRKVTRKKFLYLQHFSLGAVVPLAPLCKGSWIAVGKTEGLSLFGFFQIDFLYSPQLLSQPQVAQTRLCRSLEGALYNLPHRGRGTAISGGRSLCYLPQIFTPCLLSYFNYITYLVKIQVFSQNCRKIVLLARLFWQKR